MGESWRMHSTARLALSLLPLATALLASGCKTAEKQEDEVPASTAPAASSAPTASATTAVSAPPVVVNPTPVAAPKTDAGTTVPDAGTTPISDAGITLPDAGAATAAAAAFKACSDKCQGVLQSCAIPTPSQDGGLPQMKDPVACQAAATACFAACKP